MRACLLANVAAEEAAGVLYGWFEFGRDWTFVFDREVGNAFSCVELGAAGF